MKSLTLLSFLLSLYIITINAQPSKILEPIQNVTAISILNSIYGITINPATYEICDGTNFTCTLSGQYYTVISINLKGSNDMTTSFSAFKDVTSIKITGTTQLPTVFFNELNLLSKLERLDIDNQNKQISDTAVLPLSLKTVIFNQISVPLGSNFFEYGINDLTISQSTSGFTYPSALFKSNSNMKTLSIRIQSYANIPSNMGNYLTGLTSLTLYINNIATPTYSNITFPTLNQFIRLEYLTVIFDQSSSGLYSRQLYDISTSSIYQLSSSLKSFQIFYSGLSIGIQGFSDFSNFKPGFSLILRGTNTLLDSCINNDCIKMPSNSSLKISENDISFSNINFSNLISFENFLNSLSQTLPTTGLDNIKNLKIYNSEVYGDVPESYCQIETIVLTTNKLNGLLPECISTCLTTTQRFEKILPNEFTSFTATTPYSCPDFVVDQIEPQLMNTDGSSKLIITGKNLGWTMNPGFGNSYNFAVPNSKLEINFGPGVGVLIPQTFIFHDTNQIKYNLSYIAPTIESYKTLTTNGVTYLQICGTGFDYTNKNQITFTNIGKTFAFDSASNGCATYSNNVDFSTFSSNGIINVEMTVGGQKSNSIQFDITQTSTTTTSSSTSTSTSVTSSTTSTASSGTNGNNNQGGNNDNDNDDDDDDVKPSSSLKLNPLFGFVVLTFLSTLLF